MSVLVPVPAENIKAVYQFASRILELTAEGELPGWYTKPPFWQREKAVGGL